MKLSLGVMDVPYDDEATTYEVAKKLEARYHVMGVFVDKDYDVIQQIVVDSFLDEIDNMKMGKPKPTIMDRTFGRIEERFRDFLDMDEWQQITGETIMAARLGLTSRKKGGDLLPMDGFMPSAEMNGPRPAFIDTGLYQSSFRAWLNVNGE